MATIHLLSFVNRCIIYVQFRLYYYIILYIRNVDCVFHIQCRLHIVFKSISLSNYSIDSVDSLNPINLTA